MQRVVYFKNQYLVGAGVLFLDHQEMIYSRKSVGDVVIANVNFNAS